MSVVPLVHLVTTLLMAGVILYVQFVHYPLMDQVGRECFSRYESDHQVRTGWVVIPLMLPELGCALWLVAFSLEPADRLVAWAGLDLLAIIWLSTALLQMPAHQRLSEGFDEASHRRLVNTNWVRTLAWLARVSDPRRGCRRPVQSSLEDSAGASRVRR